MSTTAGTLQQLGKTAVLRLLESTNDGEETTVEWIVNGNSVLKETLLVGTYEVRLDEKKANTPLAFAEIQAVVTRKAITETLYTE